MSLCDLAIHIGHPCEMNAYIYVQGPFHFIPGSSGWHLQLSTASSGARHIKAMQ